MAGAGAVEELKQAVRALTPARDLAQSVLKMISDAGALAAAGDRVGALIAREAEVSKSVADVEAVYAAKVLELQVQHQTAQQTLAEIETAARRETDQIVARTKREATDYIAAREADRLVVRVTLEREQAELLDARRRAREEQQTREDRARIAVAAFEDTKERRALEIATLEARVADLRRIETEITERLAAVSAARR